MKDDVGRAFLRDCLLRAWLAAGQAASNHATPTHEPPRHEWAALVLGYLAGAAGVSEEEIDAAYEKGLRQS